MSMTDAAKHYFEQVAGRWDEIRAGYFGESLRQTAIERAYLPPAATVADVGTGTGFMAAGLAPLAETVYAIDGSGAMLDEARRNLGGFPNVIIRQGDAGALPLDDGAMDAVFANMYLHHCPDPEAAIREMVRVLRPGGRLVVSDLEAHRHEWMRTAMADEWLGFEPGQVRAWLRVAGLVNVLVDCSGQSCCAASQTQETPEDAEQVRIGVFVATGTRRVSARQSVQEHYGALAESGAGCDCGQDGGDSCCSTSNAMTLVDCCGGSDRVVLWDTAYSAEQLAAVPGEAAALSLGCGNPTAIASLKSGEVVLDIGSGAGIDAFYAARRVGPTGRVIGLDMTPAMLERARRSAAEAGLPQVEFRQGLAEAMPVEDGTVDVVLSNCVINLCEDKGLVFEEAYRVLAPGGRISISDVVTNKPLSAEQRANAAEWGGCVLGALPEREYLDLVRQAGFTCVVAARTTSSGQTGDVQVYSLAVTALKGNAEGCECGGCGCDANLVA